MDFCAPHPKLIVELDGSQHSEPEQRVFEQKLQEQGYRVVRFWNNEVFENLEGVLEEIWRLASDLPSP